MTALYAELLAALTLLTRLPISRAERRCKHDTFADAIWAYPVVGIGVGAIGSAVYIACSWIGLPESLAAIFCLGAIVLSTGGLHEDALADTADGFGGGWSRERKLEIMRDSRVGTFGVLALVFSLAVRGAAIASIGAPVKVTIALITAGMLGRGAMLIPLLLLKPARTNGLGAELANASKTRAMVGLGLAAAAPPLLLPVIHSLGLLATAVVVGLGITLLAWRQIGGHTGDVLGTTEVMVECAALAILAAAQ